MRGVSTGGGSELPGTFDGREQETALNRLLFILVVSIGSIAAGYVVQRLLIAGRGHAEVLAAPSRLMKIAAIEVCAL